MLSSATLLSGNPNRSCIKDTVTKVNDNVFNLKRTQKLRISARRKRSFSCVVRYEDRIHNSIFFSIKNHYRNFYVMLMVIAGNISFLCNLAHQTKCYFFILNRPRADVNKQDYG